jgi:hypothetical protein
MIACVKWEVCSRCQNIPAIQALPPLALGGLGGDTLRPHCQIVKLGLVLSERGPCSTQNDELKTKEDVICLGS